MKKLENFKSFLNENIVIPQAQDRGLTDEQLNKIINGVNHSQFAHSHGKELVKMLENFNDNDHEEVVELIKLFKDNEFFKRLIGNGNQGGVYVTKVEGKYIIKSYFINYPDKSLTVMNLVNNNITHKSIRINEKECSLIANAIHKNELSTTKKAQDDEKQKSNKELDDLL